MITNNYVYNDSLLRFVKKYGSDDILECLDIKNISEVFSITLKEKIFIF